MKSFDMKYGWALSLVIGASLCGCYEGHSKIIDSAAYPSGKCGLYEQGSKQLIGTWKLASDQTFGFEYSGNRMTATTIERADGHGGYHVEERIPLGGKKSYEWRRLDGTTTKPS